MSNLGRTSSWTLILLMITGCPAKEAKEGVDPKPADVAAGDTAKKTPEKPSTIPEIVLPPGDGPAAIVAGVEIPRDVFNGEYKQTLERYHRARHDVKPALMERLKDNIVRRLVDAELIRQQAKALSVELDEVEFGTKWKTHKERYGSDQGFSEFLERAGTTAADIERQFRDNLLREKVFAKVSEDIKVTDKEVKAFYDENERRYQEPEKVKASHILIKVRPNSDAPTVQKAKDRIAEAQKKVKGGADFATVAKEYSEDNTKDRGGDLGFFIKGRMVKPFEKAVWPAKVGQVVGPVETQFGFHLIKKTDHSKARKRPFIEVKEQITRSLEARKRNQAIRDALETWRKDTKIEIFIKGDPAVMKAATPPRLGRDIKPISKERLEIKQIKRPNTDDTPASQ